MSDVIPDSLRAFCSSRVQEMPDNQIVAVADLARHDASVVRLWIGEGDLPTPDYVKQAAMDALVQDDTRYSYSQGMPELRQALADYHQRHWRVDVGPDRFCISIGGMNAVVMAMQAILDEGSEVIMPTPAWPNARQVIEIVGGVNVSVPFDFHDDGRIELDLDRLFTAVTDRTRAIFINSPSNPTGWRMPLVDMERLRDFCRERDLWIVADEVYNHFVYDGNGPAPSFLQICGPGDKLLVTNTFSKNWCMTGWRAGWVVFPKGMDQLFARLCQYNTTGVAPFIQRACIEALQRGDDFIAHQVARCQASRDVLVEGLAALDNVTVFSPQGTFYLFFKVHGLEGSSLDMAKRILREAKVGVAPGSAFGPEGDAYLRICFAIAPELASQALERLVPFLRALESRKSAAVAD
ncbi:pyridoxal phosphate-dependent aminotransferase [Salinicola rhizosphaerae]|uniref:Aminotransferase n=1 Tax=Salinicola rhizosphaerae TaxID=1443141 RepID=A0ABQ3DXJ7_9GAMM|nr:pyridoxal phosphate-dependent aminotransferase [Salinicola rhizosphaerae]GHB15716.1 aminotransferase [Salinicola rhizosphaerae]